MAGRTFARRDYRPELNSLLEEPTIRVQEGTLSDYALEVKEDNRRRQGYVSSDEVRTGDRVGRPTRKGRSSKEASA